MPFPIVLASTSPYRKSILERIGITFITCSPQFDETPIPNESPDDLVKRLSIGKARAVQENYPDSFIIGSDQIAILNDKIIGKPANHDHAVIQLQESSQSIVKLISGVALLNTKTNQIQYAFDTTEVEFKKLSNEQIQRYLEREKPYNCCGSLKAEGIGVSLLKRISGDDPNTLIGLPVIQLICLFENQGVHFI